MAHTWKSFDFFEVSQVALADDETRAALAGNQVSCVCAGSDSIFVGSPTGWVRIISSGWKVVRSFQAHDHVKITQLLQVDGTSLLVTVAEDMIAEPVLKVWALDKLNAKTGMPACLSTVHINNGKKPFPISAFATLDDLSQVAVGFANGSVTLARGDLVNDLGTRQRTVYESDDPITGLAIAVDGTSATTSGTTNATANAAATTTLLIGTTARILRLAVPKRGQHAPARSAEDAGCAVGCMARDPSTGDVVVARDDALYYYGVEAGRGAPRAYEAEKKLIEVWGHYVAVVCPPPPESGESAATKRTQDAVARRRFGSAVDALLSASTFVLLEGELRLIGHTETLLNPVKAMLRMWGDLFVLTQDGKIHRYHEKPLQTRLELLCQRNMYPLAIELAQKSGLDGSEQSVIYRQFGDHLYQKGDYDGAMVQYIRAVDTTEPSQVIRKFLDTQRIHNLIQYLEQLHDRRKATADHTTLLLNCYAKLKDIDKLEAFIKSPGDDLKFDLETAISMCRQGGYYEQAAYLARQHGEIDLVVDILVEDSNKYDEALDYIWRQTPDIAYPCLQKYARVLIEHCPEDATRIFVDYYTSKYRPRTGPMPGKDTEPAAAAAAVAATGAVTSLSSGALSGAASAVQAVQNLSNLLPLPYMMSSTIATPPNGNTSGSGSGSSENGGIRLDTEDDLTRPTADYTPPAPRTAFSSFIDHPDEFIVFLEACLQERHMAESDRTDLYTTLFEMYLHKSNEKQKGQHHKEEWEAKAKKLMEADEIPMESSNVLLLSDLSNFSHGSVLVKEQSGLLFDIFRSYASARDTVGAMKALRKYGPREPQLYPAALAYLTSDPKILQEAGADELAAVLKKIDDDGLMAPLQVVQTLVGRGSSGGAATMGMIKPYLSETIERERREVAAARRRIADYKAETDQIRSELADLASKPAVFQASRCADCRLPLELPAVHFLCKHSYHQRCLRSSSSSAAGDGGGNGGEFTTAARLSTDQDEAAKLKCPQCSARNDVIRTYRLQQVEGAAKHDVFKADLDGSRDRFGTVAEWFGRGVMGAANVDVD